jgi:hypothetical protein
MAQRNQSVLRAIFYSKDESIKKNFRMVQLFIVDYFSIISFVPLAFKAILTFGNSALTSAFS